MENTEEKLRTITPELDNKQITTPTTETPKRVHGNTGKKKNFTPEQLENKKRKMREAWAKKKATQTTNQ